MVIIDADKDYIVEGGQLKRLKELEKRLYAADMQRMTADDTRDWANWLNQCFFKNVVEFTGNK